MARTGDTGKQSGNMDGLFYERHGRGRRVGEVERHVPGPDQSLKGKTVLGLFLDAEVQEVELVVSGSREVDPLANRLVHRDDSDGAFGTADPQAIQVYLAQDGGLPGAHVAVQRHAQEIGSEVKRGRRVGLLDGGRTGARCDPRRRAVRHDVGRDEHAHG